MTRSSSSPVKGTLASMVEMPGLTAANIRLTMNVGLFFWLLDCRRLKTDECEFDP